MKSRPCSSKAPAFAANWIRYSATAGLAVVAAVVAAQQADAQYRDRSGKEVVEAVCVTCHGTGAEGAPKIGDKAAWIPRMRLGLYHAVRSAIQGHGGMPPRGGVVQLTDAEIRNAVLYMFNPQATPAGQESGAARTRAESESANHAMVGGMEIYLGFVPAERLRAFPSGSLEKTMHGGVPSGGDYYHVNVSVIDQASHAPISDALVEAQVEQVGLTSERKELEAMTIGQASYGNYFRMKRNTPYRVTVSVRTVQSAQPVVVRFNHKPY